MLLEVMLALALFIGAGAAVLSIVGQSVGSLKATRERQHAVDLARSAMAELEAGIKSAEVLNGPVMRWQEENEGPDGSSEAGESGWELHVETQPTTFDGLTMVAITAVRTGGDEHGSGAFTLRQLVRLFAKNESGVGDKDDITIEAEKAAKDAASKRPSQPSRPVPPAGGRR